MKKNENNSYISYSLFPILFFIVLSIQFKTEITIAVLSVGHHINTKITETTTYLQELYEKHIQQEERIESLKEENRDLSSQIILLNSFANELNSLADMVKQNVRFDPKLKLVKSIAYANSPNFNRLWIDYKDFNTSKTYGLLYNNSTAGIVINDNGKPLALLNGDSKCSYSVFIGEKNRSPGIAMGNGNYQEMVVKYIPSWKDVNVGDKVFTSGLGKLFIAGIPVGKVKEVSIKEAYKEAKIETFFNTFNVGYFYLVEETR